ncbi:NAD-P-binding protein [Trametes elegans]|nr:NAD-P-binding protein [Trametes elegans]
MAGSAKVPIFITGATGFIGGTILQRLLQHPRAGDFEITAFVRSAGKAKVLETQFGVKTALGSLEDRVKLASLTEAAHVVIHTAESSESVEAITAILDGLKRRHETTGDVPLLLHTSGTVEFMDDARGAYVSDKIYSDLALADIEALPPTAYHRAVDTRVVAADAAGYTHAHLILPAAVYGLATGPLFAAGVANAHPAIVALLVRAALSLGRVGVLGTGVTRWNDVHVEDAADIYIRLLDAHLAGKTDGVAHGREGYFIAENGDHAIRDVLRAVADALFALGRIDSPELEPYTEESVAAHLGGEFIQHLLFTNSRSKGERARRELGWEPKYTSEDFLRSIRPTVENILRDQHANK